MNFTNNYNETEDYTLYCNGILSFVDCCRYVIFTVAEIMANQTNQQDDDEVFIPGTNKAEFQLKVNDKLRGKKKLCKTSYTSKILA